VLVVAAASVLAAPGVATAQQPTTTRASVTSTGLQAAGASMDPQISADGRWVAFRSTAALVAPDSGVDADVFLHDRLSGETRRISTGPGSVEADASSPEAPSMTPNGRYVAFTSDAHNLVAGATSGRQIFLYDRLAAALRVVAVLSPGVSLPSQPSVSDDGALVVFAALTGGTGRELREDVFLTETATGLVRRVSQTAAGLAADGSSTRS
jgi:Tol biopolymer transport system component